MAASFWLEHRLRSRIWLAGWLAMSGGLPVVPASRSSGVPLGQNPLLGEPPLPPAIHHFHSHPSRLSPLVRGALFGRCCRAKVSEIPASRALN
jgi:hypothetical protein